MKITKPSNSEDPRLIQKKLALTECEECPCCGNTCLRSEHYDYTKRHLFWKEKWTVSEFKCNGLYGCGCEFESDPYDFEAKPINVSSVAIGSFVGLMILFMFFGFMLFIYTNIDDAEVSSQCHIVGLIMMILSIVSSIVGGFAIYKFRNSYKHHEFYDKFVPIEKHLMTSKDIESTLDNMNQDKIISGKKIISL